VINIIRVLSAKSDRFHTSMDKKFKIHPFRIMTSNRLVNVDTHTHTHIYIYVKDE